MPHLEKLPLEILQYIASLLPTGCAASLALCSHTMMLILGREYWFRLIVEKEQSWQFLRRIECNIPGFYFCHRCVKLHPVGTVPGLGRLRRDTLFGVLSIGCFSAGGHSVLGPFHRIEYTHVQLALNRHRWGFQYGIGLEELSIVEPKYRFRHGRHLTVRSGVVNNELILKIQHTFNFEGEFVGQWESQGVEFCPHDSSWDVVTNQNSIPILLRCKQLHKNHVAEVACRRCVGLRKCPGCHTDFLIEREGSEYIVTLWKNLGSGRSPTDAKWLSHVWNWGSNSASSFRPCSFELGSIREAWESQGSIGSGN